MKNIWRIYKRDIKRILANPVALVIILGLCILPSLYAWFNISASWDPYGSTKGIKVAVTNNDEGGNINGKSINIGDDIVKELKDNKEIGWVFVSSEEANYGLTHDKYYASIEIPKEFSSDIASILSENPIKPKLIYRVNEKSNAIAPKITGAGTTALIKNITASFVDMVNKVIFETANFVGEEIEVNKDKIIAMRDLVYNLNDNLGEVNNTLNKAESGLITFGDFITDVNNNLPLIEDGIQSIKSISESTKGLVYNVSEDFNKSVLAIKSKLAEAKQLISDFNQLLNDYILSRGESSEVAVLVQKLSEDIGSISTKISSIVNFLEKVDKGGLLSGTITDLKNTQEILNKLSSKIDSISINVENVFEFNSKVLDEIQKSSNDLEIAIDQKVNNFDTNIKPILDGIADDIINLSNDVDTLMVEAEAQMPTIKELLNLSSEGSSLGVNVISGLKEKLPDIEQGINRLTEKLRTVASDDNINEIVAILTNNPDVLGNYISSPVELVEESVFHIPNYGSAMSPFYSVLSLWVGVLLLSSIITTEVEPLNEGVEPKSLEKYFGRLLLFLTLAIIQSLIVSIGDKYLLNVYMVDTKLFIGFSVFSAIIFTCILYTLVSLLGNVGKAVGVILLVLQVAGSGGTFPIEVTPEFFQRLQPFLPFTYSIGALREAIGGPLWSSVYHDIKILLVVGICALIIGVLLKKPLENPMERIKEKFKESGLSE